MRRFLFLTLALRMHGADIQPPPWDHNRLMVGLALYRENCAVCHDIEKTQKQTRKIGPSLNRLFKNEKLPMSHGKPNRPYVVVRIKYGGGLMPAFAKRLSQPEIDTLVDYLASK